MGYVYRETCREFFKELKVLTLSSQNIFSFLLFVVNKRDYFFSNRVYHNHISKLYVVLEKDGEDQLDQSCEK